MSTVSPPRPIGRMVAGAVLILLGVLFTLDNFGVLDAGDLFRYWPLILIGAGATKALESRHRDQKIAGLILAGFGTLLLLRALDVFWFRLRDIWPAVLLFVGAMLVWQALRRRGGPGSVSTPGAFSDDPATRALEGARAGLAATRGLRNGPEPVGEVLSEFAFMGGGERVVHSQNFRGGEVTAILGGFDIDLRGAAIAGDSATIEIFALWGGVELKVPEDWNVSVAGVPILGGISNTTRGRSDGSSSGKTLIIKGTAIMGGVEVKN